MFQLRKLDISNTVFFLFEQMRQGEKESRVQIKLSKATWTFF